jgi:hypothetical protein
LRLEQDGDPREPSGQERREPDATIIYAANDLKLSTPSGDLAQDPWQRQPFAARSPLSMWSSPDDTHARECLLGRMV